MGNTCTHFDWQPENGFTSWLIPAAKGAVVDPNADRAEWDRHMAAFLRADALMRANEEFGPMAKLVEEDAIEDIRLEGKYGPGFRNHPAARVQLDARSPERRQMEDETCERFYQPLWEAQRQLVLTPAPDLAAALFKVELIKVAEVWNDRELDRDAFEIVAEDMARLAGEAA